MRSRCRSALAVMEKAVGLDSPDIAPEMNNLAALYQRQGRYAEAEPLFKRALANAERRGPGHPDVGRQLNNLATLYEKQDRHADAEPLFRRALAIYQKAAGPEHPAVATLLSNLGEVLKVEGRYDEAEPLIKRSLAIHEKAQGHDHQDTARSLNNQADLYQREHRYADAEPLLRRALSIREQAVGSDHPETATLVNNLAALYQDEGRSGDALPLVEHIIAGRRVQLRVALPVLYAAARQQLLSSAKAMDEALDAIQHGAQSQAASAVNKLAVRLAAGSDRLADLVRKDQDLAAETEALDKAIIAAVSGATPKRDVAAENRSKARLAAIALARAALQKSLAVEFPDDAALSNPLPLKTAEIQSLLSDDEALVMVAVVEKQGYVVAITRTGFDWKPIALGADEVAGKVAAFRRGLDVSRLSDATARSGLFDLALANELYGTLLGPVEPLVKDKRSLLIVPSGALTALPFHLLVTETPPAAIPETLAGYRDAAWLIKRQAVSVLPSVASLQPLRAFARNDHGARPMTGFGNPLFDPAQQGGDGRATGTVKTAARSVSTAAYTDFWRGAGARNARGLLPRWRRCRTPPTS